MVTIPAGNVKQNSHDFTTDFTTFKMGLIYTPGNAVPAGSFIVFFCKRAVLTALAAELSRCYVRWSGPALKTRALRLCPVYG